MPAPIAVFVAPALGGAALLGKKKQARRAQAASNKWSTQFPLVDDYASQQAMINQHKKRSYSGFSTSFS